MLRPISLLALASSCSLVASHQSPVTSSAGEPSIRNDLERLAREADEWPAFTELLGKRLGGGIGGLRPVQDEERVEREQRDGRYAL